MKANNEAQKQPKKQSAAKVAAGKLFRIVFIEAWHLKAAALALATVIWLFVKIV